MPGVSRIRRIVTMERVVFAALSLFVIGVSFLPLARLVWAAVAPTGQPEMARLGALFGRSNVAAATLNTIRIAVVSALLSTFVGTVAALLVGVTDFRHKAAWVFVFILPLTIPPQVTALAWIQGLSPNSAMAQVLGLSLPFGSHPLFSVAGITLMLGITNAPLVFLSVRAALRRIPADLVEAAQAGGARPPRMLFDVILPLARMGIIAGFALALVASAGNFGIQAMLGIPARVPTLITMIYQQLNSFGPSALPDMAALSLALAVITVLCLMVAGWFGHRQDTRIEGTGHRIQWPLGRFQIPLQIVATVYFVATLLLPIASLFTNSLLGGVGQSFAAENISLDNYYAALFRQGSIRSAFATSFFLTVVTTLVLMLVALFLSYYLAVKKSRFVRGIQLGTEMAYALPGVVIGVAAILFFLRPLPIINRSLYGTIWIILVAYLSNFLALVLRPTQAGVAQMDSSLVEAGQIYGARFLRRMLDIVAPAAAPSLAAGGIIVFLSAINEIQTSILLVTSRARTIGPMIIFLEESNASTTAAAVGCLMIVVVLLLMGVASALSRKLPEGVLPWQP
jgi:iron(III) transport system permease protein